MMIEALTLLNLNRVNLDPLEWSFKGIPMAPVTRVCCLAGRDGGGGAHPDGWGVW